MFNNFDSQASMRTL